MIEPDLIHAANATSAVSVAIDDIEVQLNTNQSKVDQTRVSVIKEFHSQLQETRQRILTEIERSIDAS